LKGGRQNQITQKAVLFGCVFAACQPSEDLCRIKSKRHLVFCSALRIAKFTTKSALEQLVANVKLEIEIAANSQLGLTRAQLNPLHRETQNG
jgi:hypothetical protein